MSDRERTAIRTSEPRSAGPNDPPGLIAGQVRTTVGKNTRHDHQSSLWERRRDGRAMGTKQSSQHSPPNPFPFALDLSSNEARPAGLLPVRDSWSTSNPSAPGEDPIEDVPLWHTNFLGEAWPMTWYNASSTYPPPVRWTEWGTHVMQPTYEQAQPHYPPSSVPIAATNHVGPRPMIRPFIEKLYSMLSRPECFCDCLTWDTGGTAFVVSHNNPRLYAHVLPDAFGHSRLHSFTRQLNIYGFTRCTQAELVDMLDVTRTADYSGWHHPLFTRHDPGQLRLLSPRPSRARQLERKNREATAGGTAIGTRAAAGTVPLRLG